MPQDKPNPEAIREVYLAAIERQRRFVATSQLQAAEAAKAARAAKLWAEDTAEHHRRAEEHLAALEGTYRADFPDA
jgi:hypothetical protein